MVGLNYSHFYKEIQTGVYQYIVFGEKHRRGHSFVPSLEYSKRDLFTKGLDVRLNANYNHNITMNIDTSSYKYNWLGERKYTGSRGEQFHSRLPSRQSPYIHAEPCDKHIQAHHPLESGRQPAAVRFQHPEGNEKAHHGSVVPAGSVQKMERDSIRQILQPVQPRSCLPEQRRSGQLRGIEPHDQCAGLRSSRYLLHHQGPAGKVIV